MAQLPVTRVPVFRLHYLDLEAFVSKVYGMVGFDFLLATGLTPGMAPEYVVTGSLPPSYTVAGRVKRIRRGERTKDIGLLLAVLAIDGHLPPGQYTIDTRPRTPLIDQYRAIVEKEHGAVDSPACRRFLEEHRRDRLFVQQAEVVNSYCRQQVPWPCR